jgi:multimeric flavodoxin WrbA
MKITILNGSPKAEKSASGIIIKALQDRLGQGEDITICHVSEQDHSDIMATVAGTDALVFVFPLYVDAVPSHLLRLMDGKLNDISKSAPEATVYAIINNGFYEGEQNHIAVEIIRNFSEKAGLKWGQSICVGAGGIIGACPIGFGPLKNLGKAIDKLADNILNLRTVDDITVGPNFPKFLYLKAAHKEWRKSARKNGMKPKRLYDRP